MECLACGGRTNRLRTAPDWIVEIWRHEGNIPSDVPILEASYEFPICDGCHEAETHDGDTLDWWEWVVTSAETYKRPRLKVIQGGKG